MAAALIAVLVFQFRSTKYVPGIYWLAVVLISVVGTLITDNLVDNLGVDTADDDDRLQRRPGRGLRGLVLRASARSRSTPSSPPGARPSTGWRSSSPSPSAPRPATWSPRSSNSATCRRSGSSPARSRSSPSPTSASELNAILAFWVAYILTRPLGASIGDYLSQPVEETGLGLGTILTSVIFLAAILALVVYLTITKRDLIAVSAAEAGWTGRPDRRGDGADGSKILVVANKMEATQAWSTP